MIPAAELRTGNYVLYNTLGSVPLSDYRFEKAKELCRVAGFDGDKVVVLFLDEGVQNAFSPDVHTAAINLSPVHLTSDIVASCHFGDNNFRLSPAKEGYRYNHAMVHYLHQLQNIYFDTTGQELQVSF